jgi:predicted CoA-substrate-specific enzyme activase
MTWYMGIDIGSAYSKGVIIRNGEVVSFSVMPSGANYRETAEAVRQELLMKSKLSVNDITITIATGIGAGNVQFASQKVSDMICTARGINCYFPTSRTVIDIAGQSTKVLRIDPQGMVTNFAVSEKCAAGSGRFIEVIANVLRIKLKEFGPLSLSSKNPVAFSTGCAVFGESEAVTRVAEGIPKEDIAAGVNKALGEKAASLVKKVKLEEPCAICGGGALNIGLVTRVEQELGINVLVPQHPQIVTALGAALAAQA